MTVERVKRGLVFWWSLLRGRHATEGNQRCQYPTHHNLSPNHPHSLKKSQGMIVTRRACANLLRMQGVPAVMRTEGRPKTPTATAPGWCGRRWPPGKS